MKEEEGKKEVEAEPSKRSFASRAHDFGAVVNADGLFTQHVTRGMSSLQPIQTALERIANNTKTGTPDRISFLDFE